MRHRASVLALALAMLAVAVSGGCRGDGSTLKIPESAHPGDATYTMLYSTLGYESGATKRVLIRQNDDAAPPAEGLAFSWRLLDAKGGQAAAGRATYAGRAWGIPLWVADFSRVQAPGQYRMLVEAPAVQLASDAFPIDRFIFFRTTFSAVALENAQARVAPHEFDDGYFDSNARTGTVQSDVDFLVGLTEAYQRRRTVMTEEQRRKTREAIDRAVDYLLAVGDPGSGQFNAESDTRPYNDDFPSNTAQALRGMARFAAAFQGDEPEKADRVYRRARLSEQWLQRYAPDAYPAALRASVSYDFYRYSSDPAALDRAAAAVKEQIASYDLRTMERSSTDTLPQFEAMYRMWRDLVTHSDRAAWGEAAKKVAAQYRDMIQRNIFHLIPPGTTSAARGTSAAAQWDDVATAPPPGDGDDQVFSNGWIIARAIDAAFLADMTDDTELEKAATASLEWIGGLNAGVAADRVSGGDAGSPFAAASFLTGLGVRSVMPWSRWEWVRPRPFGSIVRGFRAGFAYDDSPQLGDTSMSYDGAWLYAISAYEDYLDAGKRAPAADPAPAPAKGVHVVSVEPSEANGLLQLLVRVADGDGAAAAGVVVVGSWSGAPLPGHPVHEATQVRECTTSGAGSCVLVLEADALPVSRPVAVSVTNLEDASRPYDITSDGVKVAEFR